MAEYKVEVSQQSGATVIRISGRAGSPECEHLEEELTRLAALRKGVFAVDLTALDFLSSVGVSALLALHRTARSAGSDMRIACNRPLILQLIKTVRMDEMMPVRASLAEALQE